MTLFAGVSGFGTWREVHDAGANGSRVVRVGHTFHRAHHVGAVKGTAALHFISRVFGIRTGMDFAWSEEDFAFYFTTGTAWGDR